MKGEVRGKNAGWNGRKAGGEVVNRGQEARRRGERGEKENG